MDSGPFLYKSRAKISVVTCRSLGTPYNGIWVFNHFPTLKVPRVRVMEACSAKNETRHWALICCCLFALLTHGLLRESTQTHTSSVSVGSKHWRTAPKHVHLPWTSWWDAWSGIQPQGWVWCRRSPVLWRKCLSLRVTTTQSMQSLHGVWLTAAGYL